jgi:membrane dipeptidase
MNMFDRAYRECMLGLLLTSSSIVGACLAAESDKPIDRAPIVLTDRARELHKRSLVIDGHNDLPWEVRTQGESNFGKLDISKPQPALHTDIPRLRQGGVGAQFWSVWVPVDLGYKGEALATTLEQI